MSAPASAELTVAALAGGVGAARLLRGVAGMLAPENLTVIVNTADDEVFHGLHVSPDVDTTIYNLGGAAPRSRAWGLEGDSEHALRALARFYPETWFRLGDADLATHLYRTERLRCGAPLHRITAEIARAFGVRSRVLPMSNDPVRTEIVTRRGESLTFQRYFVARRARDRVARIRYRGLRAALPAPGVLTALRRTAVILLPPSNPFTSILPILGLRGVDETLRRRRAPLVAVSPVAGGRAVRGPLGGMLRARGLPVSPLGIIELYDGLLDALVIDSADRRLAARIERQGIQVAVTDIRMTTFAKSRAVAQVALGLAGAFARQ